MDPSERFKGCHFPKMIVARVVFLYLRYKLSSRDIEEIMMDHGVIVDHATILR